MLIISWKVFQHYRPNSNVAIAVLPRVALTSNILSGIYISKRQYHHYQQI
jgi:hypothetical protein